MSRPSRPGARPAGILAVLLALVCAPVAGSVLAAVTDDACVGDHGCDERCPGEGDACPPGCSECACAAQAVTGVLPECPPAARLAPGRAATPTLAGAPSDGEPPSIFRPPRPARA